jgi:methyl-accepting chemotaxis protein
LFKNISIRLQLSLIAGIFLIPILYLLYAYLTLTTDAISVSDLERRGIIYISGLAEPMLTLAREGTIAAKPGLQSWRSSNLDQFDTDAEYKAVEATMVGSVESYFTLSKLSVLIRKVGDSSGLILDPDLNSYYMIDATTIQLPAILEKVRKIAWVASRIQKTHAMDLDQQSELLLEQGGLETAKAALKASLDKSLAATPDSPVKTSEEDARKKFNGALLKFVNNINDTVGDNKTDFAIEPILTAERQVHETGANLFKAGCNATLELLQARIAKLVRERNLSELISGLCVLLAGVISVLAIRSITKPIAAIDRALAGIRANDDYSVKIQWSARNELGRLVTELNGLFANEVKSRAASKLQQERDRLQTEQLRNTAARVVDSVEAIKTATTEISQSTRDLSQRTEREAANVQETVAAMIEIDAVVKNNARASTSALAIVETAVRSAQDGGAALGDVVTAIQRIEQSSARIGEIIQVMEEIAFQTKLLALNAAVESARAGESGKGFAVVATEVRSLADRSRQASNQIRALIQESTREIAQGVALSAVAGQSLEKILTSARNVAEIMPKIADASNQQARTIGEVNTALNHLEMASQQNAALVEESSAATESLAEQTLYLFDIVRSFAPSSDPSLGNRRAYERISCNIPVKIETNGRDVRGRMIDISLGGASIEADVYVGMDEDVSVRVKGYDGALPARLARLGNGLMGFAFVVLRQDDETGRLAAQIVSDVLARR